MQRQRYKILGCPCVGMRESDAIEQIVSFVRSNKAGYTVAINAEKIWRYQFDRELRSVIDKSILPYPDGAGAVLALNWLHDIYSEKVNMPVKALEAADRYALKTFIVGANETNHELAVRKIKQTYPTISLVGHLHGYHEKAFILDNITSCDPQVILIAMGSPKQEILAAELISVSRSGLVVGCGGALDILSGDMDRAPLFMVKNNLEWLYRLWKQPSRISRQLFLPVFMLRLIYLFLKKNFLRYRSDR